MSSTDQLMSCNMARRRLRPTTVAHALSERFNQDARRGIQRGRTC